MKTAADTKSTVQNLTGAAKDADANGNETPATWPAATGKPVTAAKDGVADGRDAADSWSFGRLAVVTVCIAVLMASNSASVSVLGPFFTSTALAKHPTGSVGYRTAVGFIFSVEKVSEIVAAPLISRDQPNIGSKYLVVLSSAAVGGSLLVFAFVDDIVDWRAFLGLCDAVRWVQGWAAMASTLSLITLLTEVYPRQLGFVSAFSMTFTAVGHGLGNLVAGGLYDVGGFRMPFLAIGSFVILSAVATALAIPATHPSNGRRRALPSAENHVSVASALRHPIVWMMSLNLVCVNALSGGLESVLGHRLRTTFSANALTIGAILSVRLVAVVTSPLIGVLLDRGWSPRAVQCVGYVAMGPGSLLLGPCVWLGVRPRLWMTVVSMLPLTCGGLMVLVASIYEISHALEERGLGSVMEVRVAAAGISRFALALGYALGPFLTSALVAVMGFQRTFTVYGCSFLAFALSIGVLTKVQRFWKRAGGPGATTPLGPKDRELQPLTP